MYLKRTTNSNIRNLTKCVDRKTCALFAGNVNGTAGNFLFAQLMIHVNRGSRSRSQIDKSSRVLRQAADVKTILQKPVPSSNT